MSTISLTPGMKNALTSLSNLQSQIQSTNNRLATGKKVTSAVDNAVSYLISEGFNSKARALATVQDNIGLGLNVLKHTDKALNSIKATLEQAEGTLRAALNATGTNAKAVSSFAFRDALGRADANQLLTEGATGTSRSRLQAGDTVTVNLVRISAGGTATVVATGTTLTTDATTTVQDLLDNVNDSTALNPDGQSARVAAYLNDAGNIVIENRVNGQDPASQDTYALQFVVNTAGGTGVEENTLDVFSFTGALGAVATVDGTATQTVTMAGGSSNQAVREAAANTFREVLTQVRNLVSDAAYNGLNLLQGDSLRISFNDEDTTSLTTQGKRIDPGNLGFRSDNFADFQGDSVRNFQSNSEISAALDKLKAAKEVINAAQTEFASNVNLLATRQDFTKAAIQNFTDGADALTLADINEEGARLTSLQTRQQLSITALSLANQSDQAILRLF